MTHEEPHLVPQVPARTPAFNGISYLGEGNAVEAPIWDEEGVCVLFLQ
jgi:hypothetical protein